MDVELDLLSNLLDEMGAETELESLPVMPLVKLRRGNAMSWTIKLDRITPQLG